MASALRFAEVEEKIFLKSSTSSLEIVNIIKNN